MQVGGINVSDPDYNRDVHFALRPAPVGDPFHESNRFQAHAATGPRSPLGYYLLAAFLYGILVASGMLVPMTPGLMAFAYLIAGAGVVHHFVNRARQKTDGIGLPEHSDTRHRLRVIGTPWDICALARKLPGDSAAFEPVIFRAARAHEARWRQITKWCVVAAILVGGLVVLSEILRKNSPGQAGLFFWIFVFTCGLLGAVLWGLLWPTYLRIVPGRMDILQYPILGWSKPRTRSFDLRTARVLVSIPRTALVVKPSERRGEWLCASWLFGARRHLEFERAVLMAARSTESSPALPNDELTG